MEDPKVLNRPPWPALRKVQSAAVATAVAATLAIHGLALTDPRGLGIVGFLLTIPWMVILGPGLAVSWILGWESHLEDPTGVTWGLLALMVLTNALLAALFVEILGRRPRRWPVFRRIQLATTLAAAVATLAIQGMAWADPVGGDPMPDLLTTPWLIVLGPGLTISRIIRPGRDVGGASEVTGGLLVLMALTNASLAAIFVEILGLAGRALCALTEFLSRL